MDIALFRRLVSCVLVTLLCGCASSLYRETSTGTLRGTLDVRWIHNDYFAFIPNPDDPLTFTRANGDVIRPGPMFTDGGSVPRFLWGVPGYSPWGYAPAYIIHDWLFVAHHCAITPDDRFDFKDSYALLAESMKAVMQADRSVRNYFVFDSVVQAVASPIAKRLWDGGTCIPPPATVRGFGPAEQGELVMRIKY